MRGKSTAPGASLVRLPNQPVSKPYFLAHSVWERMLQSQIQEYFLHKRRKAEEVHHGREKPDLFLVREKKFFFSQRIEQVCLCSELIRRELQASREFLKCLQQFRRQTHSLLMPSQAISPALLVDCG